MDALVEFGLMPKEEAARKRLVRLDPYALRKRGLYERLELHELGRALFHLNQRRGFKSNRKTDRRDKDSGKVRSAIRLFHNSMSSAQTVGEALADRRAAGKPVRARLIGKGKDEHYELYIDRESIEREFETLWAAQREHHREALPPDAHDRLRDVIFFQRSLRPVIPGKCFLEAEQRRAQAGLPSAQRFRLYQELNHLRVFAVADKRERSLTRAERDTLADLLSRYPKLKFERLRKALFGANLNAFRFTIESEKRKELKGCDTSAKMLKAQAFGSKWASLSLEKQDAIVDRILNEELEVALCRYLIDECGLTDAQAQHVSELSLEDGHFRLSRLAIMKVLPHLINSHAPGSDEPLTYDKAVVAAGYESHAAKSQGALRDTLPYYGEALWRYTQDAPAATNDDERQYGKIANPTVHIGLNQLRKVVNAIVARYGPPAEIAVELARELKSSLDDKKRIEEQQARNKDQNDRAREELAKLGVPDNPENRLRLKLFWELGLDGGLAHRCIYTGRQISMAKLFTNEYQIDHILPFARTLDDGFSNKVLTCRDANKYKGNQSPFEAFGYSRDGYDWEAIIGRAAALPRNKRKRFDDDAYECWLRDDKDFLARQLTDTAYLARVAKQYLAVICDSNRITVSPGRLTAMLRGKWGLDRILAKPDESGEIRARKNRNDQRHHAIDAAVIGVTDRSLLQQVAKLIGKARQTDADRLIASMPTPWPTYRSDVEAAIARMTVSYKPDHGTQGSLHNDTPFGVVEGPDDKGRYVVRQRVSIAALKPRNVKSLRCDDVIRASISAALACADQDARRRALEAVVRDTGQRKIWWIGRMAVIPVYPRPTQGIESASAPYKAYKGDSNYCYEVYVNERGRWDGELITTFRANQKAYQAFMRDRNRFIRQTFGRRPLLMRLRVDDMLAIEQNGKRRIMRIVKLTEGEIVLAEHHEGGSLKKRDTDPNDEFNYLTKAPSKLKELRARRVFVDPIGRVLDPGFRL